MACNINIQSALNDENLILIHLLNSPQLLMDEEYNLSTEDFTTRKNRIIFGIIYNNAIAGVSEPLTQVDIANALMSTSLDPNITKEGGGFAAIYDLMDKVNLDTASFREVYSRIKKYNFLRTIGEADINPEIFYKSPSEDIFTLEKDINEYFWTHNIDDFVKVLKDRVNDIEEKFQNKKVARGISVADGLQELIEQFNLQPAVGAELDGSIFNSAVMGARLGKLYITSAPSGMGKTRTMVGQACALSLPYLNEEGHIVTKEQYYPSLFISTEQTPQEIQTLILAYVSGVPEDKITLGIKNCTEDELHRITIGIKIIDLFKDYMFLEQIPDPSIAILKTKCLQYILKKDIHYIFFDYIQTSGSLLGEFNSSKLREDVILMMMSAALKDIATIYNVFIMSATQVSGDFSKAGFKGVSYLRGAKSIADKVDVGAIAMRVMPEEKLEIRPILEITGSDPNFVMDIYKNRAGPTTQVKIFSNFNYGTCHITNLFMTDDNYNPLDNFKEYKEKRTLLTQNQLDILEERIRKES